MKAQTIAFLFVAALCLWVGFTSHQVIWYILALAWMMIAFTYHHRNKK